MKRSAMNIHLVIKIIPLLCLVPVSPVLAQPNQDELKKRILVQAQSMGPDDYAFTRTVRTEQISGGKKEKKVMVDKFDPNKSLETRWTLVSVDGSSPSADAQAAYHKGAMKRRVVPGYHRLAGYFGAPSTSTTDSTGRTAFRFASLPKEAVTVFDTDVSQSASAEASVSGASESPFIEEVRITLKPMRLKLIMKLQRYESTARYRVGPEGKPLLMEQTSDMVGSGMGQEGRAHNEIVYSDYRLVQKR